MLLGMSFAFLMFPSLYVACPMKLSVHDIVLAAKQHEIEELRQLDSKAKLAGVIGHLVHSLQMERGASSIYLASEGKRFATIRSELITENELLESKLRKLFEVQLDNSAFGTARLFSLMAWVLLGLEALPKLRAQIESHKLKAEEAVLVFSQLIAGLISLIFEVADNALDPEISRSLVSLFHFIQGKEQAGQERALGALCFASGHCDASNQQRIAHLIEAQERSFKVFAEFAEKNTLRHWQDIQISPALIQVERLRRLLLTTRPGAQIDSNLSDPWFENCTDRLAGMWTLQCNMVHRLEERCEQLIAKAERNLSDSEGLLQALRQHPPANAENIERFFDPSLSFDPTLHFLPTNGLNASPGHSMFTLLQEQSGRLASMEVELDKARRALNERKVIERAKGILMARLGLSEEAAYKMLQKTAMDQNMRILDIAEATLTLPNFVAKQTPT